MFRLSQVLISFLTVISVVIVPVSVQDSRDVLLKYLTEKIDNSALYASVYLGLSDYGIDTETHFYTVENYVYCEDFDGDSDLDMFLYRYIVMPKRISGWTYYEVWYTDGDNVYKAACGEGKSYFSGTIPVDNGPPLFYIVRNITGGSTVQSVSGFTIIDGIPQEYILPPDREFMMTDPEKPVFIGFFDDIEKRSGQDVTGYLYNQRLSWIDGELVINEGYGYGRAVPEKNKNTVPQTNTPDVTYPELTAEEKNKIESMLIFHYN
jgi:hypothetical protein